MADITITAANVQQPNDETGSTGIANVAITAGQALYIRSDNSKLDLADASAEATADCCGIAINDAAAGQPVTYYGSTGSVLNVGGTTVKGTIYVVSATAGGIAPDTDIASGEYLTILGIGDGSTSITMNIWASGETHA